VEVHLGKFGKGNLLPKVVVVAGTSSLAGSTRSVSVDTSIDTDDSMVMELG
jgi:hypothetical protein